MSRVARATLVAVVSFAVACGPEAAETPARRVGHLFTDAPSGVVLDLPSTWAGRYRVVDSVTTATAGLERELAFRFVRGDSSRATTRGPSPYAPRLGILWPVAPPTP